MPNIAAIDIGSNALRFAVAETDGGTIGAVVATSRESLRLGKDVFDCGFVRDETVKLLVAAIDKFQRIAAEHKVVAMRAVATSALREARNQRALVDQVLEATGVRIEVISGEEEARLVQLAVSSKIELNDKFALIIDIGGGSIEVALLLSGEVAVLDSAPLGTVRLLKLFETRQTSPKVFARLIAQYSHGILHRVEQDLRSRKIDILIGTGGNIEALAQLGAERSQGHASISAATLERLIEQLQDLTFEERVRNLKLKPDRADVIIPAAIVLSEIVRQLKFPEVIVPFVGLREGVLLDLVPQLSGGKRQVRRAQIINYANEVGRRFDFDQNHAEAVRSFSCRLFDQMTALHNLDSDDRLLLEVAALLHDIGQHVSLNGHHKHSHYIISAMPLVGLSSRQKSIVACIARYHRKAAPSVEHDSFAVLGESDRSRVEKLSAILRLGEALDRSHPSGIKDVLVEIAKKRVSLRLVSDAPCGLEKWALERKSRVFREVFGCEIEIEGG